MKEETGNLYRTDVEFCDRPDVMCTYFNTQREALSHLNTWSEGQKGYSVDRILLYRIEDNQSNIISYWCNRDCCPEY